MKVSSSRQNCFFSDALSSSTPQIKVLPGAVIREIELQNKARKLMGLGSIQIKIRICLQCERPFQSAGRRTCGCSPVSSAILSGQEII
ncbi:MAG TPA: hypothetical protein VE954_08970 [Oligoflexus sp.]|uniref:hypothetical protein n=1 Tax=Oligoflexus sp. TaxID=1971216 RepID=UPI002D2F7C45|nr:hypothetical protein [Oligoflexus sp.]HYX33232.1 hypothetical protein [Oligoflexus sp.]